ncbi:MAG: ABC transporter permease [Anaerolineae bacterium]|nr:ABC transporter permease [Anaerolineae bacterium]
MNNLLNVRRLKILRDLTANKSRTLLVVLSIAVGVAAFGLMITGRIVLEQNLADEFAATNPAQAILTAAPFDAALLDQVKALPEVQAAEARQIMHARFQLDPDHWVTMQIEGIRDFDQIAVNRLKRQPDGTFPPPTGQIVLERSISELLKVSIGDTIHLQTMDGKDYDLTVAGFVGDLSRQPSNISLVVNGYATLPTLESLGGSTDFNQLLITVNAASDRAAIEQQVSKVVTAIEDAGTPIYSATVPPPGKQVMSDSMSSVLLILGALGALTLALSAFLIINIMSALIAQQIPQIGILKSIGSSSGQLSRLYFEMVLWFGVIGLLLAIPMGVFGAYFLADGISSAMNFDVTHFYLPLQTVLLQVFGAIIVPLLAAAVPIFTGARITVRETISQNSGSGSNPSGILSRVLTKFAELSELTRVSIANTFRRKGRLLLTLLALSLAGAMFIALLGIRESMRKAVADIQSSLNYDVSLTFAQPYDLAQLQAEAAKVSGVVATEGWGAVNGRRLYEDGHLSGGINLIAVPPDTVMTKPTIAQGRWLQPEDHYVLFVNADTLELAPDLELGKQITLKIGDKVHDWTIIGVTARSFTPIAYLPYATFEEVTGLDQQVSTLVVRTADGSPETQAAVEAALLAHFATVQINQQIEVQGTKQTLQLPVRIVQSSTTTALKTASAASLDILIVLLLVMVVLIAVVGGLGLAITMSLNVLERTREIGILRSLGATNNVIRRMVIVEGLVIGVISWAFGALISVALGIWLGRALGISLLAIPLDYLFSVPALLLWLLLVSVIAVIASLLPAQNAARLTIRDTLAYIG